MGDELSDVLRPYIGKPVTIWHHEGKLKKSELQELDRGYWRYGAVVFHRTAIHHVTIYQRGVPEIRLEDWWE